jgi:hypothetical protein
VSSAICKNGERVSRTRRDAEDVRNDARWRDAVAITVALWSFTLLIYLPAITARHDGMGLLSVALDSSTILVSMVLALALFWLFRATMPLRGGLRLAVVACATLLTAIVQAAFDLLFTAFVAHHLEASWAMLPLSLGRSYGAALNYVGVFGVNVALFQLAAGQRCVQRHARHLAEVRATANQAQVDALRLRLSPHFLFNTLNAISAMVVTRRNEEAEQGLEKLSLFLRAAIESDPLRLEPLEDEFARIDHYAQIEEMRFGKRLEVCFSCSDGIGRVPAPVLMVQPLIETAIREGVEPSITPVRIEVGAREHEGMLELTISDDAPRAESAGAAATVADIRRRLGALYGGAASIDARYDEKGAAVTLSLPLLTEAA